MPFETHLELDRFGRVLGATVWDGDNRIGTWRKGYTDVAAVNVREKDVVRAQVQLALGAHLMGNPALYAPGLYHLDEAYVYAAERSRATVVDLMRAGRHKDDRHA